LPTEPWPERRELRARFPHRPAAAGQPCSRLIDFVTDRPGHDRRYAIDCRKLERELAFAPSVQLADGHRDTFDWYLANETWRRTVMDARH
jgi:dTDP-glucose 4,6-dehydratase